MHLQDLMEAVGKCSHNICVGSGIGNCHKFINKVAHLRKKNNHLFFVMYQNKIVTNSEYQTKIVKIIMKTWMFMYKYALLVKHQLTVTPQSSIKLFGNHCIFCLMEFLLFTFRKSLHEHASNFCYKYIGLAFKNLCKNVYLVV